MEDTPSSKATLDDNKPNWEAGDQISIDGFSYEAKTAGFTTTFKEATLRLSVPQILNRSIIVILLPILWMREALAQGGVPM